MIRYFCLFNNEYEYGIVKSIHKFQYNANEFIIVIMFRSRRCKYENIYSLLHTDTWVEQIALPISWLDSIVGMIYKDDQVFPVENTSTERDKLRL